MPMTRTFLAVEIDAPTRVFMAAQVAALGPLLPSVRFVAAETWHLTLAFLGELDDAQVKAAQRAAEEAAAEIAPFTLQVSGLGVFGSDTAPRVIWLGVGGMVGELRAAQGRVRAALDRAGLRYDGRFSPHLTLARLRRPLSPQEAESLRNAQAVQRDGPEFTVGHIALMRSDLSPDGARYTAMARATLVKV